MADFSRDIGVINGEQVGFCVNQLSIGIQANSWAHRWIRSKPNISWNGLRYIFEGHMSY